MNKRMVFILLTIGILLFNFFGCGKDQKKEPGKEVVQTQETPGTKLSKKIVGKDGAPMVLIPAGEFEMGDLVDGMGNAPIHTIYLDAFYMDKYAVTNALYKKFMDATGHKAPKLWNDSRFKALDRPVAGVTWHDAEAYCDWAGKRLPTEAEWEKAARGGLAEKKYPWGDECTHDDANYRGYLPRDYLLGLIKVEKDRWKYTAPVGSFAANGYGLYDMGGNVWEWCADWYDSRYYVYSPPNNPLGPDSGSTRVVRGGSWDDNLHLLRVAFRHRHDPTSTGLSIGFRCVSQD